MPGVAVEGGWKAGPGPQGQGGEQFPARLGVACCAARLPVDSTASAAAGSCAPLQRWVLCTGRDANSEKASEAAH